MWSLNCQTNCKEKWLIGPVPQCISMKLDVFSVIVDNVWSKKLVRNKDATSVDLYIEVILLLECRTLEWEFDVYYVRASVILFILL